MRLATNPTPPTPEMDYADRNRNSTPRWHEITIIAQDPSVKDPESNSERILTTTIQVPFDYLEPGPRSHRFHVVDFNSSTGKAGKVEDFSLAPRSNGGQYGWTFNDEFAGTANDSELLADHRFFAQNVYAIGARTLSFFESALGRRISWGFDSHQLYLVPDAMEQANAYYSPANRGICFGYFGDDTNLTHTCLSYDVIAHETTHAVLDGLRPHFLEAGLPDQLAFHEALADIVALLSVFSMEEVVIKLLINASVSESQPLQWGGGGNELALAEALPRSALFGLGEELKGRADPHARALRESVRLRPVDVPSDWRDRPGWLEPHQRGEILVAAVMQTLLRIWVGRIQILAPENPTRALIGQEGAKSAEHLINMIIRGIDYCPPVEPEFEDILDAILTADEEVAPDDEHRYRKSVFDAFAAFGIYRPVEKTTNVISHPPIYTTLNFSEFSTDPDEVWKFLWQNGAKLKLDARTYYTRVCDVQPSTRVGPDGFVIRETVVCYVQNLDGKLSDLSDHSRRYKPPDGDTSPEILTAPPGMTPDTVVRLWGGGVIIFDQFGRPKQILSKNIWDWKRQNRRLRRLAESADGSMVSRVGFEVARMSSSSEFHKVPAFVGTD